MSRWRLLIGQNHVRLRNVNIRQWQHESRWITENTTKLWISDVSSPDIISYYPTKVSFVCVDEIEMKFRPFKSCSSMCAVFYCNSLHLFTSDEHDHRLRNLASYHKFRHIFIIVDVENILYFHVQGKNLHNPWYNNLHDISLGSCT